MGSKSISHGRTLAALAKSFASVAAQVVEKFVGRNGRVRGSSVVHAVHPERWLAEIRVPAPACRVGMAGFELDALVREDGRHAGVVHALDEVVDPLRADLRERLPYGLPDDVRRRARHRGR